jgi:hypothetical protein
MNFKKNSCIVKVLVSHVTYKVTQLKMSANRTALCNYIETCRAKQELEKVGLLHMILDSVSNFESKLLMDLDVD